MSLLLVITMVIQPVIFSYAMASMDHSHHASMSMVQDHDGHHAVDASNNMVSHHQNDLDSRGVLDDCCHTAACSPAAVVGVAVTPGIMNMVISLPLNTSVEGIDLPVEVKPPRSLLG